METHAVTTVICRHCHAELDVTATVCEKCGTPTNQQQDTAPVGASSADEKLLDRPWFLVVLLLHVGVLGIPAYWSTRYSLATRLLIIVASIVYTALAVAIIVWSLRQILSLF